MPEIKIKDRLIGAGHPCYVIAEMSANHGGSLDRALAIVRAAKKAGADAVKLQTYTPDTMTIDCDNEYFRLDGHSLWGGKTLYQLYRESYTPWEWHEPLKDEADSLGMGFFSTPFDESAVDFLERLNVPAYKVASFELLDDPLLKRVAMTRKPVILSTGMASLDEISHAVDVLRGNGTKQIALLRCVSSYPARLEEMDLILIPDICKKFDVVAGLSDHTVESLTAVVAVALGASIIEKHFKLEDDSVSTDAAFSLSPKVFGQMVSDVRAVESSLGRGIYGPTKDERKNLRFRRSIFAVKDIGKGDIFSIDNVKVIRPGYGLAPAMIDRILGRRANVEIKRGTPLKEDMVVFHSGDVTKISFRLAESKDSELLFALRNDPSVLSQCIVPRPVEKDEHREWFLKVMANDQVKIFIILYAGTPVGQVRYDLKGGTGYVSISISSSYRGRGCAVEALKQTMSKIRLMWGLTRFKALVKESNYASLRCFERAGFCLAGKERHGNVDFMSLEFQCPADSV
jgi:pseudaminic acid synthase